MDPVTVSVMSTTTYTTSESVGADAVVTGSCVTADGESDSSGAAVTATRISVSGAVDGACTGGGPGGFGRGRPGAGAPS